MIVEKERQIPVAGNYDVIVSGGGIAGIAAALASARTGAKTLLIEKMYLLGGLATSGLITVYLPICDGNGTQVSFGLAEELLRLSVKHGIEPTDSEVAHNPWLEDGTPEERKKERFRVRFNGNLFHLLRGGGRRKNHRRDHREQEWPSGLHRKILCGRHRRCGPVLAGRGRYGEFPTGQFLVHLVL